MVDHLREGSGDFDKQVTPIASDKFVAGLSGLLAYKTRGETQVHFS